MEHRIIDLHVHSTESDGTLTPTEIVSAAKAAGLSAFALTDHDTAAGVSKAAPAAAACGIELIPGIELSTEYELPPEPAVEKKSISSVSTLIRSTRSLSRKQTSSAAAVMRAMKK